MPFTKQDKPKVLEGEIVKTELTQKQLNKEYLEENGAPKALPKERTKLTLLEEQFCRKYIEEGFVGGRAYQRARPQVTPDSARSRALLLLRRPYIQDRIVAILNESELRELEIINKALGTKTPDQISWKEIHSFTRTSLELKGKLNKDHKGPSVNIEMFVER